MALDTFDPNRTGLSHAKAAVILSASAGSGKTYALTHQVCRDTQHESSRGKKFIAISFTNASAGDLKRRLREVFQVARLDAMNISDPDRRTRQVAFWEGRIAQFGDSLVSTIHVLCDWILRDYTDLAGLTPGFTVLAQSTVDANWRSAFSAAVADTARSDPSFWKRLHYYRQWDLDFAPGLPSMIIRSARSARIDYELNHKLFDKLRDAIGDDWRIEASDLPESLKALHKSLSEQITAPDTGIAHRLIHLLQGTVTHFLDRLDGDADFDSLLTRVAILLRDRPDIRRRIRADISRLYLDEAQDTDPVQFQILWWLTCNESDDDGSNQPFCGRDPETVRWGRKLVLVGDGKQAIYRFRGAQFEHFDALRHQAESGNGGIDGFALNGNYRSHPKLVDFYNAYVHAVFDEPPLIAANQRFQEQIKQHPASGDTPRAFMLQLIPALKAINEKEMKLEHPNYSSAYLENACIAGLVKYLLSDQKQRKEIAAYLPLKQIESVEKAIAPRLSSDPGSPPFKASEIAILVRSNKAGNPIHRLLRQAGIRAVQVGLTGYFSRPEIIDALLPVRATATPDDPDDLISLLRSPVIGFSDDALFQILLDFPSPPSLFDILDNGYSPRNIDRWHTADQAAWSFFRDAMPRFLSALDTGTPIGTALDSLLCDSRLAAVYHGQEDGEIAVANLRVLPERLHDIEQETAGGLSGLMHRIDELSRTSTEVSQGPVAGLDDDAVKIMTQHASKGLEFPVVIVTGMGAVIGPRGGPKLEWLPGAGMTGTGRFVGQAPLSPSTIPEQIEAGDPLWSMDDYAKVTGEQAQAGTVFTRGWRDRCTKEFGPLGEISGKMPVLKDISIGDFRFDGEQNNLEIAAQLDDDRRLCYVAITRAAELLILASDRVHGSNIRFDKTDRFTRKKWIEATLESQGIQWGAANGLMEFLEFDPNTVTDTTRDWWGDLTGRLFTENPEKADVLQIPSPEPFRCTSLPVIAVTRIAKAADTADIVSDHSQQQAADSSQAVEPALLSSPSDDSMYGFSQLGTAFHLVLRHADLFLPERNNNMIRFSRILTAAGYDTQDSGIEHAVQRACDLLESDAIEKLVGKPGPDLRLLREVPFLHRRELKLDSISHPEALVSGIIDLLVQRGDDMHIVDYKYAAHATVHAAYIEQLKIYAQALQNVADRKQPASIRASLLFVKRDAEGPVGIVVKEIDLTGNGE